MAFGELKKIKAGRKIFACCWCREDIPVGEPRVNYVGLWEGEFQNWHMHPECHSAYKREDDAGGGDGQIHNEKHPRGMACGEQQEIERDRIIEQHLMQ